MIKRLIKKIEETASETMVALLFYIDDKLDNHENRLDKMEHKIDKFERSFDSTKAEVDSNIDKKKGIYKAIVNAIIVGMIAWILSQIGLGG
jgi:tetrahydromethanopterin S-methyltransferase subunit G